MDRDYGTVEGHLSLQDFVDEYVLRTGRRCFVVIQNDRVSGLITTHEVKKVNRDSWSQTSVQSVMRPLSQFPTVAPETPAIQALELMGREDMNQLPVISDGHLQGVVTRGHVLRFLRTQAELHHS
jgi:CBS domain-containing protein